MILSRLRDTMYHTDVILVFRIILDTEKKSGRCALFISLQHSLYTFQNSILNDFLEQKKIVFFLAFQTFEIFDTITETWYFV